MGRMMPGEVVYIRVNPKDCMRVVEVLKLTGMMEIQKKFDNMSFPQAVSLALSSLLQAAVESKMIPDHDGFEYSEIMRPFSNKTRTSRKLAFAKGVALNSEAEVPALRIQRETTKFMPTAEQRRADSKAKELLFKKNAASDSWTEADEVELLKCLAIAAGDPLPNPEGESGQHEG
jgi:hypothetical protein